MQDVSVENPTGLLVPLIKGLRCNQHRFEVGGGLIFRTARPLTRPDRMEPWLLGHELTGGDLVLDVQGKPHSGCRGGHHKHVRFGFRDGGRRLASDGVLGAQACKPCLIDKPGCERWVVTEGVIDRKIEPLCFSKNSALVPTRSVACPSPRPLARGFEHMRKTVARICVQCDRNTQFWRQSDLTYGPVLGSPRQLLTMRAKGKSISVSRQFLEKDWVTRQRMNVTASSIRRVGS